MSYFKINYDKHNLDRARNQFKLLNDIKNKKHYIDDYIMKKYKEYNDIPKKLYLTK